jgi:hypothetical protein
VRAKVMPIKLRTERSRKVLMNVMVRELMVCVFGCEVQERRKSLFEILPATCRRFK